MPGVRTPLPQMNIDALFPKAQTRPITATKAVGIDACFYNSSYRWHSVKNTPFATFTKTRSRSHQVISQGATRYLTQDELKIGASYPVHFVFTSTDEAIERVGNSVPPLFMRAIAGQIAYAMFGGAEPVQTLQTIADYPAYLEAAWQQHLAPRTSDAPTVISTFAGAGGSSLGYSMAGY